MNKNTKYIIGIDEVGRGPIAGPVAVCSFSCRADFFDNLPQVRLVAKKDILPKLKDSKKLTKKQREEWFEYLKSEKEKGNCDFAVSVVSADQIDKFGIVPSIQKALNSSLFRVVERIYQNFLRVGAPEERVKRGNFDESVEPRDLSIYLDGGLKADKHYTNQETIIKGDELHPVISCASIIAKVTRDNLMTKYAIDYPNYGFENHVGYGTKFHYTAIKKLGLTPLHRKTFLKNIL